MNAPDFVIIKLRTKLEEYPHMEPGTDYVVPRGWLLTRLTPTSATLVSESIEDIYRPLTIAELKTCKSAKVMLSRMTGLGDQLWVSAVARYIMDHCAKNISEIVICSEKKCSAAVELIPDVKHVFAPISVEDFKKYDFHCSFFGLIDGTVKNVRNVYEQFLEHIGVEVTEEVMAKYGEPYIRVPYQRKLQGNPFKRPTVFLQPLAVGTIRDLPLDRTIALLYGLELRGYDVIIPVDQKDPRSKRLAEIITEKMPGHGEWYWFSPEIAKDGTLQSLLPYLERAEWCIGTDSSFVHFANGLGVKTIAIFGPFSAESRVKYYHNCIAIDSNPACRCARHTEAYCEMGLSPAPCLLFAPELVFKIIDNKILAGKKCPTGERLIVI